MDKSVESTGPRLLTPKEAAKYLGCKERFLERDRSRRHLGIPFYRLSRTVVRYAQADLEAFVAVRKIS